MPNRTSESAKALRWPMRATSQRLRSRLAVFVARKAVARNCARSCPIPNVPMTWGIATFAMVLENTMVKNASSPVAVTSQI